MGLAEDLKALQELRDKGELSESAYAAARDATKSERIRIERLHSFLGIIFGGLLAAFGITFLILLSYTRFGVKLGIAIFLGMVVVSHLRLTINQDVQNIRDIRDEWKEYQDEMNKRLLAAYGNLLLGVLMGVVA